MAPPTGHARPAGSRVAVSMGQAVCPPGGCPGGLPGSPTFPRRPQPSSPASPQVSLPPPTPPAAPAAMPPPSLPPGVRLPAPSPRELPERQLVSVRGPYGALGDAWRGACLARDPAAFGLAARIEAGFGAGPWAFDYGHCEIEPRRVIVGLRGFVA